MSNAQNLNSAASAAYAVSGGTGQFSCPCDKVTIDINVTVYAGTLVFTFQRLGFDGVWYTVWTNTPVGTGPISADIGPGLTTTKDPGQQCQLLWTIVTGSTFSYSIQGK